MKREKCFYRALSAMAVLALASLGFTIPAYSQNSEDLTGETCLSGTATIDPDGDGPLPAFTYCVMTGILPPNTALQMDDIDGKAPVEGNPNSVADANLFYGTNQLNDPNLPVVSGATYMDWNMLTITNLTGQNAAPFGSVENHRILDWTANTDYTMLRPQSASCLNDGSVLPKEDFTQSYIANNGNYLYFAQERRTNNGNSVYYWVLSEKPPILVTNGDCGSSTRGQLQINLTDGDIEILVNFPDSSDPASGGVFFRSYSGADSGYIPLRDAVFHSGWDITLLPVENFALNITGDGDDGFGYWGGIDKQGNPVTSGTFGDTMLAEWAINLQELFESSVVCGEKLYITAVSRASTGQIGDLTEPSALKDVIGPKLYSFGEVKATATLTGGCDLTVGYEGTAESPSGPLDDSNADFDWTFYKCVGSCDTTNPPGDDTAAGTETASSSGTHDVSAYGPGKYYAILNVTEKFTECSDTVTSNVVDVWEPIDVSIAPNAASLICPGIETSRDKITYTATVTGGNGQYSYTWTIGGANVGSACGNSQTCTVDFADDDFCGTITVKVRVGDTSGTCKPKDSELETVDKVTVVTATNN